MQGRTCLVTGGNRGLGQALALALARRGARVVITSRDPERGERARAAIAAASGNAAVELLTVDLASMADVRAAAARFRAAHDRLHVLVNNAAVVKNAREVTPEGLEAMFATNHLGPFQLTTLLLPALEAAAPARIFNVSAPSTSPVDFADLQGERTFSGLPRFGATKTCNLLATFELARRLEVRGVAVDAIHPGLVRTDLMASEYPLLRWLTWPFSTEATAAGERITATMLARPADGTGRLLKLGTPIAASAFAQDREHQRRLWDASVALLEGLARPDADAGA